MNVYMVKVNIFWKYVFYNQYNYKSSSSKPIEKGWEQGQVEKNRR